MGRNWTVGLVLVLLVAVMLLGICRYSALNDDAFITFRYGRNWAEGYGPVFNPGERVEGYTNPLLVAVSAAMFLVGLSPAVGVIWLGVLCGLLLIPLSFLAARHLAPAETPAALLLVPPLLIATNRNVAYWCTSGMETVPLACCLLAGLCCYLKEQTAQPRLRWSGFLFAVAYLLRPDALLFVVLAVVHAAIIPQKAPAPLRLRQSLAVGLPALAVVLVHLLWRRWYYGDWLPNTFYAKTGGSIDYLQWGRAYLSGYIGTYGGYAFHVLPVACLLLTRLGRGSGLLLGSIGAYLVFVLAIGGDYNAHYRLLVPLMPLFALVWGEAFRRVWTAVERRFLAGRGYAYAARGLAVACLIVLTGQLATCPDSHWMHPEKDRWGWAPQAGRHLAQLVTRGHAYWMDDLAQSEQAAVGRFLGTCLPPDSVIAVYSAGMVPYYSRLRTVDMFGLSDRHLARSTPPRGGWVGHEKHDGAYIYSKRPDLILLSGIRLCLPSCACDPRLRVREALLGPPNRELACCPGFWDNYTYVLLDAGKAGYLEAFLSRRLSTAVASSVVLQWRPPARAK